MTARGLRRGRAVLAAHLVIVFAAGAAAVAHAAAAGAITAPAGPAGQEPAAGQAPSGDELEALTRRVSSQLRCVVCQGLSIEDSPSDLAREMKDVVRDQLAAGRSPEEVRQYFVDTYGEWILLEPEPAGFNLAVYVLPVLALGAGIAVVAVALRRWTRRPVEPADAAEPGT